MKKTLLIPALFLVTLAVSACARSTISGSGDSPETKETEQTTRATVEVVYSVEYDENAQGPAGATVVGDLYVNYSDDKKPQETEAPLMQVRYFYVNSKGMHEDFDSYEGADCTAEDLIRVMVDNGVLTETSAVISYDADGKGSAVVELSSMEPMYADIDSEKLAQAVANTFCDNLELDEVTVKVGDKTYGPLKYKF